MERQLHLCVGYYHFCLPHSGLWEEISSHEGEWVSQEVAGGHPDDGGGSDGSRIKSC